jgi:hypothetical protein
MSWAHVLRGATALACAAISVPCFGAPQAEPAPASSLFELGVRAGIGTQNLTSTFFLFCVGDYCEFASPTFGADVLLRLGRGHLRWENQAGVVWAPHVWAESSTSSNGVSSYASGPMAATGFLLFTTGLQYNSNPGGSAAFLLEAGGSIWRKTFQDSVSMPLAFKCGLGAMVFSNWEITSQIMVGPLSSAQLLVGYDWSL